MKTNASKWPLPQMTEIFRNEESRTNVYHVAYAAELGKRFTVGPPSLKEREIGSQIVIASG